MRVTTIIKDYITSEVDKKFQEKLKNIPNEYQEQMDRCIDELEELNIETNKKANEIRKKYNMYESDKKDIFSYSNYYVRNKEEERNRSKMVNELRQEKSDKIAEIILGLELGETNKKELTDILKGVEF